MHRTCVGEQAAGRGAQGAGGTVRGAWAVEGGGGWRFACRVGVHVEVSRARALRGRRMTSGSFATSHAAWSVGVSIRTLCGTRSVRDHGTLRTW